MLLKKDVLEFLYGVFVLFKTHRALGAVVAVKHLWLMLLNVLESHLDTDPWL